MLRVHVSPHDCSCLAAAAGLQGASRKIKRLAARGLIKVGGFKPGYLLAPASYWPPFNSTLAMEQSDHAPPVPQAELPAQTDGDGYRIRYYHDLQYHVRT